MKKLSKRKVKQRRKVGIAKAYISRAAALKKLQIPLADFRRLCILKGIYPIEPKNKSKLTGGNTRHKTYFFTRDIQYLINEPLLYKFWEFKVFMKRLTKAKGRHDYEKFKKINETKPSYRLDELVKERYPRFTDALRDCDDALSMCFLFAMFPKARGRPENLIDLSRKLTIEFMHYVIETKSLRKVFISIKGYYYQVEIMGQTITWMVPHQFVIDRVSNVDLSVMKTFTEFYITLLGFINYKLYKSIDAVYPPQLVGDSLKDLMLENKPNLDINGKKIKPQKKRKRKDFEEDSDDDEEEDTRDTLIAGLNKKIKISENKSVSKAEAADQEPDVFEDEEKKDKESDGEKKDEKQEKMSFQQILALEKLFDGLKFFLNREVPRESLTFVIRSFGGEVSWDKNLFPGATFDESDPDITHQIVDRATVPDMHLNRVYIQPQWVYDCINMRMILPTADYLIGSTLPPHLSPFVNEKRGDYVPPDKVKLMNLRKQFEAEEANGPDEVSDGEALSEVENTNDEEDNQNARKKVKTSNKSAVNKSTSKSKMSVKQGKLKLEDKEELKKQESAEERKMAIMMIHKKKKRLFDKITRTQAQRKKKTDKLKAKRRIVDAVAGRQQKSDKKFAHKTKAR